MDASSLESTRRAPDSLARTVGTSSPYGTKRTISAICRVVSDPRSCRLPCLSKERDDMDYNHMRTMVHAMQKDRRLIRMFHSEFTTASVQLASQISHVLAEKFSTARRALHQLLHWFTLVWVLRHSDISSELLQDAMREIPKAGHRIMSWMLQISKHVSLQTALMYTAVFEEVPEARWIACGRRGQKFCHDRGLVGGKVFWGGEFVHQPTGAIAKVDVAQDRVSNLWEITHNPDDMEAELGVPSKRGRPLSEYFEQALRGVTRYGGAKNKIFLAMLDGCVDVVHSTQVAIQTD